jgi:hypothetical protein
MSLVPQHIGPEIYSLDSRRGAKASPGTGFDPDNKQHVIGSDAVRYAIALQQLRDAGDYGSLDKAREQAKAFGFVVMQECDGTRVKPRQKAERLTDYECPVIDGIFYDCEARQ